MPAQLSKWAYGVPVPGVYMREYRSGWRCWVEPFATRAGHWRATVADVYGVETSLACAGPLDAMREAELMKVRRERRRA